MRSSHVSRDLFLSHRYPALSLQHTWILFHNSRWHCLFWWQLKWTPHYCLFTHAFTLISMVLRLIKIHMCLFTLQSTTNHDRHYPIEVFNGIPGVDGPQPASGLVTKSNSSIWMSEANRKISIRRFTAVFFFVYVYDLLAILWDAITDRCLFLIELIAFAYRRDWKPVLQNLRIISFCGRSQ